MVIFTSLHFDRCIPSVPVTNPLSWRLLFFLSMEETRMSADSMLARLQGRIAPMQSMTRLLGRVCQRRCCPTVTAGIRTHQSAGEVCLLETAAGTTTLSVDQRFTQQKKRYRSLRTEGLRQSPIGEVTFEFLVPESRITIRTDVLVQELQKRMYLGRKPRVAGVESAEYDRLWLPERKYRHEELPNLRQLRHKQRQSRDAQAFLNEA